MKRIYFLLTGIAIVAIFHFIGTYFYLYWRIPIFDQFVHLVGGFVVAYAAFSFVLSRVVNYKRRHIVLVSILSALIVGLAWELFELQIGFTALGELGYWRDTIADLLSDIAGGIVAAVYVASAYTFQKAHEQI